MYTLLLLFTLIFTYGLFVLVKNNQFRILVENVPSGFENVCEDENNVTKPYVLHAEANAITKIFSLAKILF